MTAFAISLSVTSLAQRLLLHRARSVMRHEITFMAQEALREQPTNLRVRVARRTRPLLPLLLVLVTAETRAHWRQPWSAGLDDAPVTRDALPECTLQRQVSVVIECNHAKWPLGRRGDLREKAIGVTLVATRATTGRWQARGSLAVRRRVTSDTGEACGFAGNATCNARQVQLVRKAHGCVIAAGQPEGRNQYEQGKPQLDCRSSAHGTPRTVEKSKS